MKAIADLVVGIAELAESEARALRDSARIEVELLLRALGKLVVGLSLLALALLLTITGLSLVGAGLASWLEPIVGHAAALAIVGGAVLGVATACIVTFRLKFMTAR